MEVAILTGLFGGMVGLLGGGIAVFNSYMGVRWKRAELANSYMKDFNANAELVFAGRCLDWNGGKLALPDSLQPYMSDGAKIIEHDKDIYYRSINPILKLDELNGDPRLQIYRTSIDTFLSWLALVGSAVDRGIFRIQDIEDVAYWVSKIEPEPKVLAFIKSFGYESGFRKLRVQCRTRNSNYRDWRFLPWR